MYLKMSFPFPLLKKIISSSYTSRTKKIREHPQVSVAQWIAHRTSNPEVVGSSPIRDVSFSTIIMIFHN